MSLQAVAVRSSVDKVDGAVDAARDPATVHALSGDRGMIWGRPSTTGAPANASVQGVIPTFHTSDDDRR
jgi:hypothetical protein